MKFLIFLLFSFLNASIINDFKNGQYSKICVYKNIKNFEKNEKILSLIGVSCVKSDRIYLLPSIIRRLKHTKEGLNNSIYFLTIYTQKKLLYAYLFNNLSLQEFNLPLTDYILSKIFIAIKNKNFEKKDSKIIIKLNNEKILFYKQKDKMIVEEYKNNKFVKRRWYR